jgi:hypothetical protein
VIVQDLPASASGGTFTASGVPVAPTPTTITAIATDAAGNLASATITVTADAYGAAGVIGPAGGTVEAPPGPLEGAAIIVPPGAVATDTRFEIRRAEEAPPQSTTYSPVGPALELLPTGVPFAQPVTVVLPFSRPLCQRLLVPARHVRVVQAEPGAPGWTEAVPIAPDWSHGTISASATTFSLFQAVA